MEVKVLLVCEDKTDQQAYLAALRSFGLDIDIIESPARLYQKMIANAYNGVLVDLKTKLKSSDRGKAVIHDAVEQFPVVQLKLDHRSGQIRSFHFGRSRESGTLEAFINEECCHFAARPLRKSTRRPAHFNVQLRKSSAFWDPVPLLTVTVNVSAGGCFIYTIDDYEIDSEVTMILNDLEDQTPIAGFVRWRRAWGERMQIPGIGIQFGALAPAQLEDFREKAKLPERR